MRRDLLTNHLGGHPDVGGSSEEVKKCVRAFPLKIKCGPQQAKYRNEKTLS